MVEQALQLELMNDLKFKKLRSNAILPDKTHALDACFDLYASEEIKNDEYNLWFALGLAVEIPDNHVGLIFPRSSISLQHLSLANCVGVIDSTYRGEIEVRFKKTAVSFPTPYSVGMKIAQILVIPIPQFKPVFVRNLSNTVRGSGGFGSTGV